MMVETEEECRAATERAELGRPGATDVVLGQGRPGLCVLFFFFPKTRTACPAYIDKKKAIKGAKMDSC